MKEVNGLKKVDPVKLVKHIEDAENWLKKAKEEFNQANPVRGELSLNLAQAEVKYVWELSHRQYVSEIKKPAVKRRIRFFIPAAASIILIVSTTFFVQSGKTSLSSQSTGQVGKSRAHDLIVNVSLMPQKTGNNEEVKKQVAQIQPEISRDTENAAKRNSESEKIININQLINEPNSIIDDKEVETSSPQVAETIEVHERENIQNQLKLQPVSQLSIDEETLTKEASRSLRNGK